MSELSRPNFLPGWLASPDPLVLTLLLPAWAAAFAVERSGIAQVGVIGLIAVSAALILARLLWRRTMDAPIPVARGWVGWQVIALVGATLLWVWLQYALNPFRMRGVLEALSVSRSAPWQLAAGLGLFTSVIAVALVVRAARTSAPAANPPSQTQQRLDRLAIRLGDRTYFIDVATIERLQAADDHVALVTGGRRMLASYRMAELHERLDHARFVRIHRSHIVNVSFVVGLERRDANRVTVVMKSGERIVASRKGTVELRQRLRQR